MTPPKNTSSTCSETRCEIILFWIPDNKIVSEVVGKVTTTTATIGGASYIFEWDVGPGSAVSTTKTALNATGGVIGTIILDIIALVFIWVAFMAAKNVSKAVSAIVQPFEEMGKKMGGLAMSLPKYAPILPGGISVSGANKLMDRAASIPEEISSKKTKDSTLWKMLGMNWQVDTAASKKVEDRIASNKEESVRARWEMAKENLALMMKDGEKYIDNSKAHNDLMKAYKDQHKTLFWIEDALKSNGMDAWIAKKMAEKIFNDKTTTDPEVIKLWKESVTKTWSVSPISNASLYNISITPDGKWFNIGTVRIEESLDADVNKIAEKMQASSLNKSITENDLKETLKRGTTQFWSNEQRMNTLIEKLGKNFFKEDKAVEPKKP